MCFPYFSSFNSPSNSKPPSPPAKSGIITRANSGAILKKQLKSLFIRECTRTHIRSQRENKGEEIQEKKRNNDICKTAVLLRCVHLLVKSQVFPLCAVQFACVLFWRAASVFKKFPEELNEAKSDYYSLLLFVHLISPHFSTFCQTVQQNNIVYHGIYFYNFIF